jgi:alpha-beta hydrolase superfamily lysophospholipase
MLSYKNDPWIMNHMTARLLHEMSSAGDFVCQTKAISFDVPVHFFLAGDDKLVRSDIAKNVYANISAPAKTLITYENFYHEIFNETNQVNVFKDLVKVLS